MRLLHVGLGLLRLLRRMPSVLYGCAVVRIKRGGTEGTGNARWPKGPKGPKGRAVSTSGRGQKRERNTVIEQEPRTGILITNTLH